MGVPTYQLLDDLSPPTLKAEVREFLCSEAAAADYPNIAAWWDRKVLPRLAQPGPRLPGQDRVVHLALQEGKVVGVSVSKKSPKSWKICTLRVHPENRNQGIGNLLLLHTFNHAWISQRTTKTFRRMHLTISEAVDKQCGAFFAKRGFRLVNRISTEGRASGDELVRIARPNFLTFDGRDLDQASLSNSA